MDTVGISQDRILGIDCGLAITGWSILERPKNQGKADVSVINYGVVTTGAGMPMGERLSLLYSEIQEIIVQYKPSAAAVESLFYFKNQKTVMGVGQARGVVLLAITLQNIPYFDYTPLQVKQSVTGYGRASKQQVQSMVKSILKLQKVPKPDDAADALAVGICHLHTVK